MAKIVLRVNTKNLPNELIETIEVSWESIMLNQKRTNLQRYSILTKFEILKINGVKGFNKNDFLHILISKFPKNYVKTESSTQKMIVIFTKVN